MSTLFISDLHLREQAPEINQLFYDFLNGPARDCQALYILGDLFEYWIGDDDGLVQHVDEVAALQSLSAKGVSLYFMHGNRDFLIGQDFAQATGATLLDDPCVIDLYGRRTLLAHGDAQCTDDTEHQAFRAVSRNEANKQRLLALPVEQRRQMAQGLRAISMQNQKTGYKPEDITDVNPQTISEVMQHYDVRLMIHGHTHRPAVHDLFIQGEPAQRIVLTDWHPTHGGYLFADTNTIEARDWPGDWPRD